MRLLLLGVMGLLLLRAPEAMSAAESACALFVRSVLPGLFPYLVLSQMLLSRCPNPLPPWGMLLLGWCGGSPSGARLLATQSGLSPRTQRRLAISCATMSPMFLFATLGSWLNSAAAGGIVLFSVLSGGWLVGACCERHAPQTAAVPSTAAPPVQPVSFAAAIEDSARTMLLVCGTMTMLRIFATLLAPQQESLRLLVTTLLEVTTGTESLATLPLPLPLRTALTAGAAAFGGVSVLMQNRAFYPPGLFSLPAQCLWQLLHALLSMLLALGLALLLL